MTTRRTILLGTLASAAVVAGCAPAPTGVSTTTATPTPVPVVPTPTPTAADLGVCGTIVAGLTLEQQVAQLYMVAVSTQGLPDEVAGVIRDTGVGSVVLLEQSTAGAAAILALTDKIRALSTPTMPILVAVDQEGGVVQRLKGDGFDTIPNAVNQGEMPATELTARAKHWGEQLTAAGVKYNLAPVGDVVPAAKIATNEPIGKLKRGYSSDPAVAAEKVGAFVQGMTAAGVATSVKHFPGLGEVTTNTDFGSATDNDTVEDDEGWQPFVAAIAAGVSSIMVSSAVYTKMDAAHRAMYSHTIVTQFLRGKLGFERVVISDDVGAAEALKDVPMAERGTRFIEAGGDLVINAVPGALASMIAHTVSKAQSDAAFAEQVARSAARVLELKASVNLIDCG